MGSYHDFVEERSKKSSMRGALLLWDMIIPHYTNTHLLHYIYLRQMDKYIIWSKSHRYYSNNSKHQFEIKYHFYYLYSFYNSWYKKWLKQELYISVTAASLLFASFCFLIDLLSIFPWWKSSILHYSCLIVIIFSMLLITIIKSIAYLV